MSKVTVPDVRQEPWSTDATVIVDVASLTHRVAEDVVKWLGFEAKVDGGSRWTPEFIHIRSALLHNLHRVVDLLGHHGVQTGRLLLAVPINHFPPAKTGWRASQDGSDEQGERQRAEFLHEVAGIEKETRHRLLVGGNQDIEVRVLAGYFSADGEHCVDEQCVLAAAMESWNHPTRTVFVLSWDADVTVAPWLAGHGPILLARDINASDAANMAQRLARHRPDHLPGQQLPPHLRLTIESLRTLLVHPGDIPCGAPELRDALGEKQARPAATLSIETGDDGRHLVDRSQRDDNGRSRRLTRAIGTPSPRRWFELRRDGLMDGEQPCAAVVVVDSFGLMTTANRAGIPALVPSVTSVERALAPLGIRGRLGQLAVIPDILNRDHGLVQLSNTIDGQRLEPTVRDALTAPLRNGLRALDVNTQQAIDSYRDDARPWTIATTSVFSSINFTRIGRSPVVLEEKESTVFLAADIMWALVYTDLPVIVLSDRADLMVALHLIEDHIGSDYRVQERIVRVGLHADTFRGEGFAVKNSRENSPWTTVLLTARMVADLLRLDSSRTDEPANLPQTTDLVAFDPISSVYDRFAADGHPDGHIPIGELAKLPLRDILPLVGGVAADAAQRRKRLTDALELHLDLRPPLPRPMLMRRGRRTGVTVRADEESAEVTGHALGLVQIRRAPGDGPVRKEVETPMPGYLPPAGSKVSIVVEERGGTCTLILPDLSLVPAEFGRPRPATVLDNARARLEFPLDPEDNRDDIGETVRLVHMRGPFPAPRPGDVVLVTHIAPGRVQAVSTAVTRLADLGTRST